MLEPANKSSNNNNFNSNNTKKYNLIATKQSNNNSNSATLIDLDQPPDPSPSSPFCYNYPPTPPLPPDPPRRPPPEQRRGGLTALKNMFRRDVAERRKNKNDSFFYHGLPTNDDVTERIDATTCVSISSSEDELFEVESMKQPRAGRRRGVEALEGL